MNETKIASGASFLTGNHPKNIFSICVYPWYIVKTIALLLCARLISFAVNGKDCISI
jgi:hypothetical protein